MILKEREREKGGKNSFASNGNTMTLTPLSGDWLLKRKNEAFKPAILGRN